MIENLTPITAIYGGWVRVGRVAAQHCNEELFFAHLIAEPSKDFSGAWVDMAVADENVKWIRGVYEPDSVEARALLAVEALR